MRSTNIPDLQPSNPRASANASAVLTHLNRTAWPADVLIVPGGNVALDGLVCFYRDGRTSTFHPIDPEQLEAELAAAGLSFEHRELAPSASILRQSLGDHWTEEAMPRPA